MTRTEAARTAAAPPPEHSNSAPADGVVGGFRSRLRRRHGELLRRRRIRRGALIGLVVVPVTGGIVVAFAVPMFGSGTRNAAYQAVAGPGHGRGMSQVGAFDQATAGATADGILAHYYPGAQLGTIAPTTVRVRLTVYDKETLDVYSDSGLTVAGRRVVAGQAAHLTPTPDGGANVVVTIGCDGDVLWRGSTDDPWAYPADPGPDRPAAEHLKVCDGSSFRGVLGVTQDNGQPVTVNQLDVEDYLLGVVPAEMEANWADKGGAEALRAQAVAARSYALAEHRYPYAQTCDTTDCQMYPGTDKEDSRAADAVHSTAGQVLMRDGHILRTEYSAAPGGGQPIDITTLEVGPTPAELESAPGAPAAPAPAAPEQAVPEQAVPEQAVRGNTAIDAKYAESGGAAGPLGDPMGPESLLPGKAGTFRLYKGGVIIATPTLGAQIVDYARLLQIAPQVSQSAGEGAGVQAAAPGGSRTPGTAATPTPPPAPSGQNAATGPGPADSVGTPAAATGAPAAATGAPAAATGTSAAATGAPADSSAAGIAAPDHTAPVPEAAAPQQIPG
ncbi:SpoIID/LytB domain-containing protein [Nocardia elegans]|uniref:SpoIID/LytB domain-containing protein n=1 Tax=Nocardia elegans TaxID=300029 RepID=UPI001E564F44|nr:SpoIID/LytB domain-containing protein [Nocardia elegans]